MTNDKIPVLIVEPERNSADTLLARLRNEPGIEILNRATSVEEAISLCSNLDSAVTLLDLSIVEPSKQRALIAEFLPIGGLVAISNDHVEKIISLIAQTGSFGLVPRSESNEAICAAIQHAILAPPPVARADFHNTISIDNNDVETDTTGLSANATANPVEQSNYSSPVLDGKYKIEEILGKGATSTVYLAVEVPGGRRVALKVMHHSLLARVEPAQRFEREVRVSISLDHPNIGRIYSSGFTETGQPYAAMEYLVGEPLDVILKRDAPISSEQTIVMAQEICSALQVAHDKKVVHRDLKPANLFITETGTVKILDFGLAKHFDGSTEVITAPGSLLGTAFYMSPEQCFAAKLDGRSDIYSLGCILYECVTGIVAFPGTGYFQILMMHVEREPDRELLRRKCPKMLCKIIEKALANDPNQRYQSATAMNLELEEALQLERKR